MKTDYCIQKCRCLTVQLKYRQTCSDIVHIENTQRLIFLKHLVLLSVILSTMELREENIYNVLFHVISP